MVPLCWLEGKDIVRYPPKAKKERALRKKQYAQQDWMYGKIVHRKVTGTLIYISSETMKYVLFLAGIII